MLASPLPASSAVSSVTASNTSVASRRYYHHDWPLNEIEENVMTLATCSQIRRQQAEALFPAQRCRSSVVRCQSCQRKFHSAGNLANHQQLYQHY